MSEPEYAIRGDAAEVLYALPTVKALGGGRLSLYPSEGGSRRAAAALAEALAPLLLLQPYVSGVRSCAGPEGIDLGRWRDDPRSHLNPVDRTAEACGAPRPPCEEPWLVVPEPRRVARVVIHRAAGTDWHNFPWSRVVRKYGPELVFAGSPADYRAFCAAFGPVPFHPAADYLTLASVIAGGQLFVGNSSPAYACAEGLKVLTLREVGDRAGWHFGRWGVMDGGVAGGPPELDRLAEMNRRNVLGRTAGRTVLTADRLDVLARLVQETRDLPGEMAELGVYQGGSAMVAACLAPEKTLHLFDTFAGLPAAEELAGMHARGEFAAPLEGVRAYLAGRRVVFHPGVFPQTVSDLPHDVRFSFVHVDADLYCSTRAAIDYFWPRLVPGGAMVFDDVDWGHTPGVNRALQEAGLWGLLERATAQQGFVRKGEQSGRA